MIARVPWWVWFVAGVVVALVAGHWAGLLLAVPGVAAQRRTSAVIGRELGDAGDDLVEEGERLERELEADQARRREAAAEVAEARRRALEASGDARTKWGRFWPLLLIGLMAAPSRAQDVGVWLDGERPCISLERYEPATPLPLGCRALVPGVLLTVDEEHRRVVRTNELAAEAATLRLQLEDERRLADTTKARCAAELQHVGDHLRTAGAVVELTSWPSPWPDRLLGAGAGALLVGLTWLAFSVAP